jgi:Protein of unknown function (DUF3563)
MLMTMKSFANMLRVQTRAERELAYLNESLDRHDLEYRQRQIDQGLFRDPVLPNFLSR